MKKNRRCGFYCSLFLLFVLLFCGAGSQADAASRTTVYFAKMDGIVGVPLEEHVENVFKQVETESNPILVFQMNTPGGLVDSMSEIMTLIAEADFPVVVWVYPGGSRAASAGAFIVQSAHIAVMAPGTNIGAAHPVAGNGGDIKDESSEMDRKIVNDLTAKMRSFAQERGRNVKVAESMVRDSVSLTAREALAQKVVDFLAADEAELLKKLDGRTVKVKERLRTITMTDYEVKRIEISPRLRMLSFFSRPDIAYLALIAGIFLIILEAKAPGGFVMGTVGALLLIMASYGLRVLPVNFVGVALLIGGIIIMVLDFLIGGMGILIMIGTGAMLFGGLMLFKAPGGELLHLSAGFFTGVTLVIAVVFLLLMRVIFKALKKKPALGESVLIGQRVRVKGFSEKGPMVMVRGEYWSVRPVDPESALSEGDEVEIVSVESMLLYVKPVDSYEIRRRTGGHES